MITKEEINELKKEFNKRISELEDKLEPKQGLKRWKPEEDENYYYVDSDGDVMVTHWSDYNFDNFRYSQGNCFKTEQEAQEHLENLKTKAELRELAQELNEDEVIDWENLEQGKYFLFLDRYMSRCLRDNSTYCNQAQGTIYCLDKNFTDRAIERIGKDRLIKMIKSGV